MKDSSRTVIRYGLAMALSAAWLLARAPIAAQGGAPTPAAPIDSSYVIQRGDELSIKVFGRPELDDTVTVRNDGRISALLIDDLDAAGLTPRQLVAALTERYEKFFRAPQVNAIVRRAAALKVFVGGEVAQPGAIPIVGDLTALAAVYQAGGFTRAARTDSVVLLRDSHGDKPLTLRLDLKKLDIKDSGTALQARDVIYVPASRIAKVDRFVDEYVRQLIPISLTAGFSYVMGPGFTVKP